MASMAFEQQGDLLMLLHGKRNPSEEEWSSYCAAIRAIQRSGEPVAKLLVISDGGGPNAKQRNAVVDAFLPGGVVTAVCTDGAFARGITTAIAWFNPHRMMSHGYRDVAGALAALEIASERREPLMTRALELQATIGATPFRGR